MNALTKKQLEAVEEKVGRPYYRAGSGRKLSEADVEMALSLREYGFSMGQIAKWFGCHKVTVKRAIEHQRARKRKSNEFPIPYLHR